MQGNEETRAADPLRPGPPPRDKARDLRDEAAPPGRRQLLASPAPHAQEFGRRAGSQVRAPLRRPARAHAAGPDAGTAALTSRAARPQTLPGATWTRGGPKPRAGRRCEAR